MTEETETLGAYLRRERKKRDISVEQIAYATRISLKMLTALEEDRHQELPAQPFVRGYLQAYAKYVRLDPKDVVLRYQHHLATQPGLQNITPRANFDTDEESGNERQRVVWITVGLVGVLLVSGIYFLVRSRLNNAEQQLANRPPVLKNIVSPSANTTGASLPSAQIPAVPEPTAASTSAMGIDGLLTDTKRPTAPAANLGATPSPSPALSATPMTAPVPASTTSPTAPQSPQSPPVAAAPPPVTPAPVKKETASTSSTAPSAAPAAPSPSNVATSPTAATPPASSPQASPAVPEAPKKYTLNLKAKEDVWLRLQADSEEVKDFILRKDKAVNIRANKLVKIFSGNLNALVGTLNGAPLETLTTGDWKRSAVIPASEAPNVKLPLFPGSEGSEESKPGAKGKQAANPKTENPTP